MNNQMPILASIGHVKSTEKDQEPRLRAKMSPILTSFFPPHPAAPCRTSGRTFTYQLHVRLSSSSGLNVVAQESYSISNARNSLPRLRSFSAAFAAAVGFFTDVSDNGGLSKDFIRYARADCGV